VASRLSGLVPFAALAILFLASCGGSTFDVQNPPPPPPQDITIAFATPPPTTMSIAGTASLTATVTNDPSNAGVDWALTCSNQTSYSCGSLSSQHSASGEPITFSPPTAFTGNADQVTIVAYAAASHQSNTLAPIAITAFGSVLQGTYVFQVKGTDASFGPADYPYQLTGQVYLDGNGNVGGSQGGRNANQQTLNTFDVSTTLDTTTSSITGGSYFVGADGRGTLVLLTTDQVGDSIEEDFTFVVLSGSNLSLAQVGGTLTNSQGPIDLAQAGSGSMSLQDPAVAGVLPSAGFAFTASGTDNSTTPIVYGGVLNIDNPTGISGSGTLTDQGYNGVFSSCSATHAFAGSSVVATPVPGVVTLNFVTTCAGFNPAQLTGYIVDSSHIDLIETDGAFFASGQAVGQGSATGSFSSFSGNYIFDILGIDLSSFIPSSLTSVDVISADQAGTLTTGYTDTALYSDSNGNPALISSALTGVYQLDNKGIGRVHLKYTPAPVPFFDPSIVLYLTAPAGTPGAPALALYSAAANQRYPALGIGVAYPQAQPAQSLSFGDGEQYGFLLAQQIGSEIDGSGQMTAALNPGSGGTLSGLFDASGSGFPVTPSPLAGLFGCPQGGACPDSFGRFSSSTLTLDGASAAVDFFLIDQDNGFLIETDAPDTFQLALGSFVHRCDVTISGNCQQSAGPSKGMSRKARHLRKN